MRTSLWIALSVLTLMLCGGMAADRAVKIQSERYVSAAEEIRVLAEDEQWKVSSNWMKQVWKNS